MPRNVVNIMDALRQSIAQEQAASAMSKKPRKRSDGQGEMLLPIPGKKTEVMQKAAHRSNARQKKAG